MKLNPFIKFVLQTILFFCGIPFLISFILVLYSIVKYDNIIGFKNLLLLEDVGMSIVLYQSFLSPLLILIFKKLKWIYIEFWSVFYLTLPIYYIINGRLKYEPGDEFGGGEGFLLIFITTIIYYELFYKTYLVRQILNINERFGLKIIISKIFKSKSHNN